MNNYPWKLSDLIGDYEEDPILSSDISEIPIMSPQPSEWKRLEKPDRLSRMYKFSDETKFNSFIIELLELQSETQHHARITMQYPKVKVEVWTHSLNEVTDIDREWADRAEKIYGDFQ